MKTSAEKTSSASAHAASRPFIAKPGSSGFFSAANSAAPVQLKMTVNQAGDKYEQEADKMSERVLREPAQAKDEKLQRQAQDKLQKSAKPAEEIRKSEQKSEKLQKSADSRLQKAAAAQDKIHKKHHEREALQRAAKDATADDKIHKKHHDREELQRAPAADETLKRKSGDSAPVINDNVQTAIRNKTSGGQPLAGEVKNFMEPRFGADFSHIRVHHDGEAASLNNRLSAKAFTYKNHVFFSRGQYRPDTSEGKQLIAHELTHTIQQGHAVQRSPQISPASPPPVQRLGMQDALDYFADKARLIPGFSLLTLLLGFNPINMQSVDRSAANLLRALIELLPGGAFITQALDNHGVINKAATWVEQKLAILGDIGGDIIGSLKHFIDSLSAKDIFDLGGVWARAKSIFTEPIGRLITFGGSAVVEILKMVKDAILKPLAALAQGTSGYDLLKAMLGEDPISGEAYPATAENLLGDFMKLIGQEEIWENIKKGNAIARAYAWFQGALDGLKAFVRAIPRKIVNTITSLTFQDVITVVGAFGKIVSAFATIAVDFISWGLKQVLSLLEIIFSVVAPNVMQYIKKAQAAFSTIIKDPIGFVNNLVRAGKRGFELFASNILTHLKTALIKWITGPLGDVGVYIPKSFDLLEIIKLVLSVLGLTWQNIRGKLVKIIPEPILIGLEKTAGVLVTLVKDGPAAAWEQIKTELSELKDQMIAKVTEMITSEVVKAAVTKLVTMLNPAGAVVQAIIAIYNTITFFIQKIEQIAAVVASFIDSISAIAAGDVEPAAKKVEQTMVNTLVVMLAFLAKFVGLGNVPDKVVGIVKKIRQPIDKGLDKIVEWLGNMLKKAKSAVTEWWKAKTPFTTSGGNNHEVYFTGDEKNAVAMVASKDPKPILNKLEDFRAIATGANATDKHKKAIDLINKTQAVVKTKPEEPTIVDNMRQLFETFDEKGPVKKTVYNPVPTTIPNDPTGTVVGGSMFIDWLNSDFINEHPGSSPGGGQDALMELLVVNPKNRSSFKYVRGHLLNENLGGKGENQNLFPITANANSQHLKSTEKEIKDWVIPKSPNQNNTTNYALYEVKVNIKDVKLSRNKIEENLVNAEFNCRAVLKDDAGTEKRNFMTTITSEYRNKNKAETYDLFGSKN